MLNPIEIIDKNGTLTPWSVCEKRPEGNPYWNPGYTVHGHNKRVAEVADHYFPETAIVVANMIAAAPTLYQSLDPDTLEAIADEIGNDFKHSARAASLRGIAKRQREAMAAARGE